LALSLANKREYKEILSAWSICGPEFIVPKKDYDEFDRDLLNYQTQIDAEIKAATKQINRRHGL